MDTATTKPPALYFRITAPLPLRIDGGITKWIIQKDYYDKGGKRMSVIAKCLDTGEVISFIDGRTREVENTFRQYGVLAQSGTTAYKIAHKLIRLGKAERILPGSR